ncbi:MAG: tetratricopeptide repeat family protein, partial [Moraxellaceae bacterium]|nr:tetratricopeptide repeat family protein [Moraxellaceae bacterium]
MRRLGVLLGLALCGGTALAAPDLETLMQGQFNPAHYALGYEVFLNNGNTAAAFRVAERAVQHRPDDMEWRRRLATVARWQNRGDVALDNWLVVARATDADDAWEAVRELAAQLFDHEAWLAVQQREARTYPEDGNRLDDLVLAYEQLGRPEEGLAFLAQLSAAQPTRALLEARARLAERNGQPDLALAALRELVGRYSPPEEDWLARAAALHYERGELDEAWALLAGAAPKMSRSASRFWQVYGHLSHVLGQEKAALQAYGHLDARGQGSDEDLQRYSSLLQKEKPGAAANVQARLYRRSQRPEAATLAVFLWARARDAKAAEAFLDSLEVAQLDALEADPAFREARGDLRLVQGRWQDALADYEAALKLAPGEARVQQAWLSLMTEHGEPAGLRRLLLEGAPAVEENPRLASAWAAGWLRLDEPAQALPWLRLAF